MVTKKAQAMMELAIGMFALVLVVSALASFSIYIIKGLEAQAVVRADVGKDAIEFTDMSDRPAFRFADKVDPVDVDSISAKYLFGTKKVNVRESVYLPPMRGL